MSFREIPFFSFADHFYFPHAKESQLGLPRNHYDEFFFKLMLFNLRWSITTVQHSFIHLFFWLPGKFSTAVTVRNSLYSGCIQPSTSSLHLLFSGEVLNPGYILESPGNLRNTKPGSHPKKFWCNAFKSSITGYLPGLLWCVTWVTSMCTQSWESPPARPRLPYPNLFNRLALTPTVPPFSGPFLFPSRLRGWYVSALAKASTDEGGQSLYYVNFPTLPLLPCSSSQALGMQSTFHHMLNQIRKTEK